MLKKIAGKVVSVAAVSGIAVGQAFAALPTEVTTAMTDMKTDGIAVATAFLVATIAVVAFLFMRKGAKA
jgi:polyferredoxin